MVDSNAWSPKNDLLKLELILEQNDGQYIIMLACKWQFF